MEAAADEEARKACITVKNYMYYSDMSAEQRNEMITSAISYCKVSVVEKNI